MTALKWIGAMAALALMAQPALAQDSSMDHSKMDHAYPDMAPAEMSKDMRTADAPIIIAKVNGLVCDFCAQALRKVFKKEAAVDSLNVDLDAGEVRVELKLGQTLSDARVETLIRKSGYSLVGVKREGGA